MQVAATSQNTSQDRIVADEVPKSRHAQFTLKDKGEAANQPEQFRELLASGIQRQTPSQVEGLLTFTSKIRALGDMGLGVGLADCSCYGL